MTEWMRLGAAGGTLVVALLCVLTAATTDENLLRSSPRGEWAFRTAAVFLIVCIPLLALEGSGALRPLEALGLIPPLAGAAVLAGAGWRFTTRTARAARTATRLGLGRQIDHPLVRELGLIDRLSNRAAPERVRVLLVSVAGDRHVVELNQN